MKPIQFSLPSHDFWYRKISQLLWSMNMDSIHLKLASQPFITIHHDCLTQNQLTYNLRDSLPWLVHRFIRIPDVLDSMYSLNVDSLELSHRTTVVNCSIDFPNVCKFDSTESSVLYAAVDVSDNTWQPPVRNLTWLSKPPTVASVSLICFETSSIATVGMIAITTPIDKANDVCFFV